MPGKNLRDLPQKAQEAGRRANTLIREGFSRPPKSPTPNDPNLDEPPGLQSHGGSVFTIAAIVLVVVGAILLLTALHVFWWLRWQFMWPILLIGAGLVTLAAHTRC